MGGGSLPPFFSFERGQRDESGREKRKTSDQPDEINAISDWFTSLSGGDAICWAFDTVPSQLDFIYWSNTDSDIRAKIRLRLGIEKAKSTEYLQGISLVVSSALGTRKARPKPLQSGLQAELAFRKVFGEKASFANTSSGSNPFKGLEDTFKKLEEPK